MEMVDRATTVDEDGRILGIFTHSSLGVIEANNHGVIIFDAPQHKTDYWDFSLCSFVSIGMQPSSAHIYDYNIKKWVDHRSLDEIKTQKWTEIKSKRDDFEFGIFEFEGNIYDSDQVSQARIMGAVLAGLPQIWTLANNTTVSLSAEQLKSLYAALQMHVAVAHERGRIAREAIQAATTKEQIEAIVF